MNLNRMNYQKAREEREHDANYVRQKTIATINANPSAKYFANLPYNGIGECPILLLNSEGRGIVKIYTRFYTNIIEEECKKAGLEDAMRYDVAELAGIPTQISDSCWYTCREQEEKRGYLLAAAKAIGKAKGWR